MRSRLEYGSVIWDPYLKGDIDKLEKIQRSAARYIKKDYRSRQEGCVTEMLQDLGLPSLEERRRQLRLMLLYEVVGGRVPAINIEQYLKSQRPKRTIRAKQYEDFVLQNIVDNSICNNNKCFKPIPAKTENFRHSFFVRTVYDWNKLSNDIVNCETLDSFKSHIGQSD